MVARNQKWLIGLILLLLVAALLVVILDRPPALPTVMILPPSPLAVKTGRVPDWWIPVKWAKGVHLCLWPFSSQNHPHILASEFHERVLDSSLFSMESNGANGCRPGDSSNLELPCALQTLARLAIIAR